MSIYFKNSWTKIDKNLVEKIRYNIKLKCRLEISRRKVLYNHDFRRGMSKI